MLGHWVPTVFYAAGAAVGNCGRINAILPPLFRMPADGAELAFRATGR